jgi:hypothetical protein
LPVLRLQELPDGRTGGWAVVCLQRLPQDLQEKINQRKRSDCWAGLLQDAGPLKEKKMATFIKTENEVDSLGSSLLCPNCNCNNLHQEPPLEPQDDDPNGGNWLQIKFYCEQCPAEPVLSIQQYKGTTYIGWHSMRVIL